MNEKIFILGASSDFGIDLLKSILRKKNCTIGLHCFSGRLRLETLLSKIKISVHSDAFVSLQTLSNVAAYNMPAHNCLIDAPRVCVRTAACNGRNVRA